MLLILVGPSAVGKSTIAQALVDNGIATELKSHTTRASRGPNDNYYFVSREDFENIEFAERVEYAGNLYGLSVAEIRKTDDEEQTYVVVVEMHGVVQILKLVNCPTAVVFIDAPDEHLQRRLKERGSSPEEVARRLGLVPGERKLARLCDFYIENSDGYLDVALHEIADIIDAGGEDVGN